MSKLQIGRLDSVDLRTVWENEATSFTPWLADNLDLLGSAIGVDLELEAQEQEVGPFRADLLCKDTISGQWVLIENQLEKTDHIHLGQLLTYAAGLKAATIVWVARIFTDQHRAALDWLNEITDSKFNFFGLEVELWRIGESLAAPKFNVVCKPNDWSRTVSANAAHSDRVNLSEGKQLQLEYWTAFCEHVTQRGSFLKTKKPLPQNWMYLAVGRTGFKLSAIASLYDSVEQSFSSHELRAEFVIDHKDSAKYYAIFETMKEELETEVGEPLVWYNPEDKRVCTVSVRRAPVDLRDRDAWGDQHEWLIGKLETFHRVFSPRLRQLE